MKQFRDTDYYITEEGEVFSKKVNRFLTKTDSHGYYKINLVGYQNIFVHRLVAECYIPNIDNKPVVNHIDGNKRNNNVNNLEWCTISENTKHSYSIGLQDAGGEKNSNAILTKEKVIKIRYLFDNKLKKIKELSKEYNVSQSAIKGVIYRANWKEIK